MLSIVVNNKIVCKCEDENYIIERAFRLVKIENLSIKELRETKWYTIAEGRDGLIFKKGKSKKYNEFLSNYVA